MHRLTLIPPFLALASALVFAGCEVPSGALEDDQAGSDEGSFSSDVLWVPSSGVTTVTSSSGYVIGPETMAVFVGESMSVELELLEPKLFELRAGLMPEEATFTGLPAGALVEWQPGTGDIGTHDFVLLVVDTNEPNLVIAQEMFVVDVLPRLRFIEYGF